MLKQLRLKFVLINMCIVTAMLLVIFGMVLHFTKLDLENQSAVMLQSLAQTAKQSGGAEDPGREVQLPYFIVQVDMWGEYYVRGYTHYDLTDEQFVQELLRQVYSRQESSGSIGQYDLLYRRINAASGLLVVFLDVSSHRTTMASMVQGCVLIGLASFVVFFCISLLLAWWAVKPVDKAWKQQRQFVSDASHELKTPLSVIMSNAELLQDPTYDAQSRRQFADNILTTTYRMRTLTEGLLELARADGGQMKQNLHPLDLSRLTEVALLPFEPVLFEKGMTVSSQIEPGITVNASTQRLEQLLGILLDNAGKYGSAGMVTVGLHRVSRGSCVLSVANPGAPIPQQELEKIFDRFYRTDTARTADGSFGLGLSIAKSIVQAHGGKIWAISNETGNCFFVQLPTA